MLHENLHHLKHASRVEYVESQIVHTYAAYYKRTISYERLKRDVTNYIQLLDAGTLARYPSQVVRRAEERLRRHDAQRASP